MKKSLFSRYFRLCVMIILSSVVVLGLMLMLLSAQYFKQDNLDTLEKKANQVSLILENNYAANNRQYIDFQTGKNALNIFSAASEADFFLVDPSGRTLLCTDTGSCRHSTYIIDSATMAKAKGEGYRGVTTLGSIYEHPSYVVGVPIRSEGVVIGSVFAGADAVGMSTFLKDVFRIFLIGALLVFAVACIVVYFSTEAMVRPLRTMVRATDSFARGDFSARVPLEGDEEIQQLARAINNMAANLATLEDTRRSFIANVSHELKTPMTTIGGFVDGILDGTIPAERYPYYLGIISTEVRRLSRMVVSMLNISRMEAGEMPLNPCPVDVHELICRTFLGFERPIEEKKIDVQGLDSDRMMAEADPDLVSQIVYNLIENAVKFTPVEGAISVSYQTDGRMLRVAIRNSGSGIPKEEIPHLFERFYKSDRSRGIDKKGVGLGLYIVKSLVHLQGGEITVKSAAGEYTEFIFTLPQPPAKSGKKASRIPEKRDDANNF